MREYRCSTFRHAIAHRPEVASAGCNLLVETLPKHLVEKYFGERRRQFGTRLAVTTLSALEARDYGGLARSRRIAIHQSGEFIVGQPDLRHARPPMGRE